MSTRDKPNQQEPDSERFSSIKTKNKYRNNYRKNKLLFLFFKPKEQKKNTHYKTPNPKSRILSRSIPNSNPIMLTVIVKWQKEVFKAVEIDTSQPPYVFKCQLYDLTGVPPERQKIMVKGGLLKDDADWSTVGVKQGQKLMMMGTADEVVKAPEKGPVFMEDLPEEEQVVSLGHSAGLFNLGNTCYMNSTVQCLHSVPELKSALVKYSHSGRSNDLDQTSHMLTVATRDLFGELDKSVKPVAPMQFWMVLRKKFPQFGQLHNGAFMQQDAEECWTQLLYTLSQSLRSPGSSENLDTVKDLFGIELASRIHCQESGEESSETESVYSLKCHISHEVNHLHEGLKHGLKSELEKASPALGRSAVYLKESRINGLPRYLTIQFVRFFWKRESNQKAKILRKVDYPLELDVYDLCSDELRKQLEGPRQVLRDEEGKRLGLKANEKSSGSKDDDVKMTDAEGSSNASGESSVTISQEGVPSDKETRLTGIYGLVAVLTHKGRSADSGHYVAWVKQESGKWIEFDDDNPIPQREEDIVKLSGGGDWHMAYICIYKARTVLM
ncbi:ubiquitin carboxyl-terminal hydrolase 6-like [Durio zibethinus]|uniref:Ubiquitin carboxyl-terminal hydrolase n=1 Tax=Durio zibethinus TaxID=66656 RepID=A0A6P5WZD2_DURZI|nr:ubiquitin carboxyl-terminal hydrolase 6-like [Durio zibethinus]